MTKTQLFELAIKALPYPQHMSELELSADEDAIQFVWRGTRFRVSSRGVCAYVEEVQGTCLAGTNAAMLMERCFEQARTLAEMSKR